MDNKNIMLCLEVLGIGGVETYVVNQSLALKKKGYNVFVVSREGIYSKILSKAGIICINFDFKHKESYNYNEILEFVQILKKYDINEVHINQFTAMDVVFSACLLTNTPYVVYLHMTSAIIDNENLNAYNWLEKTYSTYKEKLSMLFKYATNVVAITPEIKDYTVNRYKFDDNKCIVLPNSIDFSSYISENEVKEISNVLIIGRLNEEKKAYLINAINLYIKMKESFKKKLHLNIVGDGPLRNEISEYINKNNLNSEDVTFYGAINNVKEVIDKNDVVIGLDRCILEAIAMKKIAIISSYKGNSKGIIKKEDILVEINENFCGDSLANISNDEIVKDLLALDAKEIKNIVNENYNLILNKLDINNNLFVVGNKKVDYLSSYLDIYSSLIRINNIIGDKLDSYIDKCEKNWNDHLEYKNWIEELLSKKEKELEEKTLELNRIYSSRSYMALKKASKFVKKIIKTK